MLFSSPVFFLFFAVYYLLHLATPLRYRKYLIIAGSTVFYAWWKVEFVWLPWFLMAIAYWGAEWMQNAPAPPVRKRRMIAVVTVTLIPLLFFKYTNFLYRDVLGPFFGFHGNLIAVALPLGVSFVTFTLIAYVVDIYRGEFKVRHKPSTLLQYVLFFPHLISGPILRPWELIPQLENPRTARRTQRTAAIVIFTVGLVKKLLFADQIGEAVDAVYRIPGVPDGWHGLLALYGFTAQIYCDFSGYTDMAIGLALLLGVQLPNNFARPYAATSLVDFWRRWHITLSFWLHRYLYIPLGGNRHGAWKEYRNIFITMMLGGLWHGANWTFVIWGTIHGAGVCFLHFFRRLKTGIEIPAWIGLVLTFNFVTATRAFFRSPTAGRAVQMLSSPFGGHWGNASVFAAENIFPIALIALFLLTHGWDDHRRFRWFARRAPKGILWPVIVFLWIVAIAVSQGSSAKFVYFDF